MKKNLKAYLIDAKNQMARAVETEDELDALYSLLDCDMIEIHSITIAGNPKVFDVVMDEEGTFKADPKISAINEYGQPMFVGSLLTRPSPSRNSPRGTWRAPRLKAHPCHGRRPASTTPSLTKSWILARCRKA